MAKHKTTIAGNRYRNPERDKYYEDLEKEILESRNKEPEDPQNPPKDEKLEDKKEPKKDDKDKDTDWQKRYGDLQRHMAGKEKEWNTEKSEMESRLKALEEKASLPKNLSDDKIEEWEKKFPDVAAIIEYKAQKKAKEIASGLETEIGDLKSHRQELDAQRAVLQLVNIHDDFLELRESEEFAEWLTEQDEDTQDAINNPADYSERSVRKAANVVKFFKLDTNWGKDSKKPDEKKPKRDTSAAEGVDTKGRSTPDDANEQPTFSESQIAKMSSREFEKNKDAIMEAHRNGKIVQDMSGAAQAV